MDLSAPYSAVMPLGTGEVLAVLARTTRPLSGREVARLGGGSPSTVRRTLQHLVEHGLVHMQEAGARAALLYSLNRDHIAAEAVLTLLDLRRQVFDRLAQQMNCWAVRPWHASVFGSAARASGNASSDIDLLVVRPTGVSEEDDQWRSQLDRLPGLVRAWTGNHLGVSEVSEADVERLGRERPPIVEELRRDAIYACWAASSRDAWSGIDVSPRRGIRTQLTMASVP